MASGKITGIYLFLFAGIWVGCVSVMGPVKTAAAEKLRVGINLTTIETLPIYLAADGLAGDAIELSGGAIPSLTAGKADVVTNAETQAILRSVADPGIRVILTVAEYSYRIVARRAAGIVTTSDLRAKKIATTLNSSAHFYVSKILGSVGLSERDVTVVGMPPSEMPAALARGDVDAVSIWEPAAQKSAEAIGSDAVILQGPRYRERFNLNTTAPIAADPVRRARVVDLLRSIIRSSREVRDHPEQTQRLIAAKLNLPQQFVSTTWRLFEFPASIPDDLLETMVEQEPWMAEKQNRPPRSPEAIATLIDASLWQEAKGSL
ncbi:MAG: ABC transporter substrate-binding protein [Bradyrhizobiaceae bacterium]|nr:ABC transporter substrate-binding protein [Bradyrhizobiaceae bacterium]